MGKLRDPNLIIYFVRMHVSRLRPIVGCVMPQPSKPIGTSATARILEKSEGTIRNLVRRGLLTATRTESGTLLFNREHVEALARRMRSENDDNEAA